MRQFSTRRGVFDVPQRFLLIALLARTNEHPKFSCHLVRLPSQQFLKIRVILTTRTIQRDHFFISHCHPSEEGFPEEVEMETVEADAGQSDADSLASVVIRKISTTPPRSRLPPSRNDVLIPAAVLENLREMAEDVTLSIEIKRHMLDTVIFMRMHRAVAGGVSPRATKDFELLVRLFCLLLLRCLTPSADGASSRNCICIDRCSIQMPFPVARSRFCDTIISEFGTV